MYLSSSDAWCSESSASEPVRPGELTDGVTGGAGDAERVAGLGGDRGALRLEQYGERAGLGRADPHEAARAGAEEILHRRLGDQAATADDDQPVGGQRHLAHQVTGQQDG